MARAEIWGLIEIAEFLEVPKQTANSITQRASFPAPKYEPAVGRFWRPADVRAWKRKQR